LEYLEGGSLDKYVSDRSCGLDWHTCYAIIRGVCEGLNYLHNGSKDPIFHLDLKPANILLNKEMMPKIGDFGLSRLCPSAKTCTTIKIMGTPGYMPPEYIERCQITSKFDIFSLGVIIIQIMAGRKGYFELADMTSQEFIKLVHEKWLKRLHTAASSHTSHEVKRCIEIALKCVEVDRVKRPTIAEVVDELNKIDTSNASPPGQVTNLQNKQDFKYVRSEERRRSNVKHKVRAMWWWRLLPLLWVVGWSFASLWIFFFMNSQAVEKRRELLISMCDERARLLQDQFNVSRRHMHALAVLVSTFHYSKSPSVMDQMTFAKYAERTELPLMSGLAYAVRVKHAEREQFELQQGWRIKRMCSSKNCLPGPGDTATMEISEEYAPVIFAQDSFKNVISFDMLSGIDDSENILRATESGKGVLTAPFKLGVLNNRFGVILTYTLYKYDLPATARTQERSQAAVGYLGGIFGIEAHIDKVLQQLVADKKSIMVSVYDTTRPEPIRMHGSNDTGSSCIACISHSSTLNFGDPSRRHEMHCRFTQGSPWPWPAITSSFGTLVTVLLFGYKFNAVVNHNLKVENGLQNMVGIKKRA